MYPGTPFLFGLKKPDFVRASMLENLGLFFEGGFFVCLLVGIEFLPLRSIENPLPHPDRVRRDFHELIEIDVVEAGFKRHLARGF